MTTPEPGPFCLGVCGRVQCDGYDVLTVSAGSPRPLLRYMRKRAASLTGDLQRASQLLQHDGTRITREHYMTGGETFDPLL